MSEAITPAAAGNGATTAADNRSAAELFAALETGDDIRKKDEAAPADEDASEDGDAEPQGDAEPDAADEPAIEDDGEPDADEGEPGQTEEPATAKASDEATVEIDGKAVSVAELKRGYLREADYTRKTQEVADGRREVEAAVQRLTALEATSRNNLELAEAVMAAFVPPAPDPSMMEQDPIGYMRAKEAREQAIGVMRQITLQKQTSSQQATQEQQQSMAQAQKAELTRMVQVLPELATSQGQAKFLTDALEVGGKAYGLTEGEVRNIQSAKELMILKDALAYRKLQSQKMKAVAEAKKAPPIVKPGARDAKPTNAVERLKKLGASARARDIFTLIEKENL